MWTLQGRFWRDSFPQLGLPDSSLAKLEFQDGYDRVSFRCMHASCSAVPAVPALQSTRPAVPCMHDSGVIPSIDTTIPYCQLPGLMAAVAVSPSSIPVSRPFSSQLGLAPADLHGGGA